MSGQNLLQANGASAQKQTHYGSIFTSRFLTGLVTNRSPLRGPLGVLYTDFYKIGTTDVLIDGLNAELSTRLTMIRRPGNPVWCSQNITNIPDFFYSFHHADGTIQVITDTNADVQVTTTSTSASIFTKTAGAGEGYFAGINKWLYIADGIDLVKYTPGITNPQTGQPIWNFGGAAPTTPPVLTVTETGSSGVTWQASTMFTTMGLLNDGTNIQVLVSTMQNGNTTQFGLSGQGTPNFSTTFGGTVVDNTCTWTSKGQLKLWSAGMTVSALEPIYDSASNGIYVGSAGTEGTVRPSFNPTFNTHTTSSTGILWQFIGTPQLWQPSTTYNSFWEFQNQMVVFPVLPNLSILNAGTPHIYVETNNDSTVGHNNSPGTSGTGYTPVWGTTAGTVTNDNQLQWVCLGSKNWAANTNYAGWSQGSNTFNAIIDGNGNFQVCISTGVSQATTPYNGWQASHSFVANSVIAVQNLASTSGWTAFKNNGSTGTSGSTQPTNWDYVVGHTTADSGVTWTSLGATTAPVWGQNYGAQTTDGTAIWVCVGTAAHSTWVVNTTWYLPASGFAPPTSAQPYGGANVVGSSWNQFVTQSGLSGGSTPSWGTSTGALTTDSQVTWTAVSAFGGQGFTWTKGYGYVYAFKARTPSDIYVTTAPPLAIAPTPNFAGPLGPPTGSQDGSVTTASPVAVIAGAQTIAAQIAVSGQGSTDPQFDTVSIYRSTDGFFSSGPYLFLTDIPMPPAVNGVAGTWTVIDYMPDTATNTLPGLDPLEVAPIDHANDPPPGQYGSLYFTQSNVNTPTVAATGSALIGLEYHQGRLWGFVGNNVFASGGPDTNPGNGFTAWPPDQVFPFESTVVKLLSTEAGLLIFTTTALYVIAGGPAIVSYYSQLIVDNLGILSPNAVCIMMGIPHVFTSDNQLLALHTQGGYLRVGHPIGNLLAPGTHSTGGQSITFNPANVYLTYHSSGDLEHALFLGDGATGWFRCDTSLAPDADTTGPVWSPWALVNGGHIKALQSVETSPGVHQLLIGDSRSSQKILARDSSFTTFSDNGVAYDSYFTMGNIVLAQAGQMARLEFVEMDFIQTGTQPSVYVMYDEISPTGGAAFEKISDNFVTDPPKLWGPTAVPYTVWMNRYYFGQTTSGNPNTAPLPAWCKSIQVKVDFGNTDTVQNELMAFTIFGALHQEK